VLQCVAGHYGVARVSSIDLIVGLFCRISSHLQGSFAKEIYNFIDPTDRSHPITLAPPPMHAARCVMHTLRHVTHKHVNMPIFTWDSTCTRGNEWSNRSCHTVTTAHSMHKERCVMHTPCCGVLQ